MKFFLYQNVDITQIINELKNPELKYVETP